MLLLTHCDWPSILAKRTLQPAGGAGGRPAISAISAGK